MGVGGHCVLKFRAKKNWTKPDPKKIHEPRGAQVVHKNIHTYIFGSQILEGHPGVIKSLQGGVYGRSHARLRGYCLG